MSTPLGMVSKDHALFAHESRDLYTSARDQSHTNHYIIDYHTLETIDWSMSWLKVSIVSTRDKSHTNHYIIDYNILVNGLYVVDGL